MCTDISILKIEENGIEHTQLRSKSGKLQPICFHVWKHSLQVPTSGSQYFLQTQVLCMQFAEQYFQAVMLSHQIQLIGQLQSSGKNISGYQVRR